MSLENALLGEASALQVSSDAPVMAGMAFTLGDSAQVAPVSAGTSLGTFTSPGGTLQLTNPGDGDAQATVTVTGSGQPRRRQRLRWVPDKPSSTHSQRPRSRGSESWSVPIDPCSGPVVSSGEAGSWAAPLESMTEGETPPLAAELDPELH